MQNKKLFSTFVRKMETIKIWNDNPSEDQLQQICSRLEKGDIMLYPTDTLYAIGCDAMNVKAIERICRLKGINPDKTNLSIICASISQASEYARIDDTGYRLMRDYTPGPFTFLFHASSRLPKAFKGRKTVGIRVPNCNLDLKLVEYLGKPLLTTSVECDDTDYTVNPSLLAEAYQGRADFLIDGGEGSTEPSTIIDCTDRNPQVLRAGKGKIEL